MSRVLHIISLLLTSSFTALAKTDEWFQECKGDECGYSLSRRGTADCYDYHPDCRRFALGGECLANPVWMKENCQQSCGLCVPDEPVDEDCRDLHSGCPKWAGELECFANPLYMSRACPKSCWLCVNATELREEGVSEEEIEHRRLFSQTDFGLWQSIPDLNREKITQVVLDMGLYTNKLETIGPGTLCNNRHHECAQWVVEKGGCEADLQFMLPECSLVCRYCNVVEEYHYCRTTKSTEDPVPYGDLRMIQMHLLHEKEAENLLHNLPNSLEPGEWIFAIEHSNLWTNKAEMLSGILLALKSKQGPLQWTEASSESFKDLPHDERPDRSGRLAICSQSCQREEPIFGTLTASIATLLQVDPAYLQALEFVHYKRGERFSAHHDFRIHDRWRHSGNRVLTTFVALQNPQEGGSFGFPEYGWLQIREPQVLVWPNVAPRTQTEAIRRMRSEQLPVVEGEMYGVYIVLRQYPYDSGNSCA